MRIRNPWGKLEWQGDWSDKSEKWTPELKRELNVQDTDDGTFFMSFKDFLRFFSCTYICKYHDGYKYYSEKFHYEPRNIFNLYKIDFAEKTHGYFIINLKNSKIYKSLKCKKNFMNPYCVFMLYKLENNSLKLIGSKASRLDRQHIEADVEPGSYIVSINFPLDIQDPVVDLHSYKEKMKDYKDKISYRIGFYSAKEKIKIEPFTDYKFYEDSLHSMALNLGENNKLKEIFYQEGEPETWRCLDFSEELQSIGFLAYNNKSNAIIREQLYLSSFVNVRLLPMLNTFNDKLSSNENEDIIEDDYEASVFSALRNHVSKNTSTITHKLQNPKLKEITEENPLIVELCIAPNSTAAVIIEKFEEFASVKANSEINMVYPVEYVFSEKKFSGKKTRIKYKNDFLNIFENIIKFPTGVLFKYKNKTKEYKIEITIAFDSLENLQINTMYTEVYSKITQEFRRLDKRTEDELTPQVVMVDPETRRAKITLYPNHCAFVEAVSLNLFQEYSFKTSINYNICISDFYLSRKYHN